MDYNSNCNNHPSCISPRFAWSWNSIMYTISEDNSVNAFIHGIHTSPGCKWIRALHGFMWMHVSHGSMWIHVSHGFTWMHVSHGSMWIPGYLDTWILGYLDTCPGLYLGTWILAAWQLKWEGDTPPFHTWELPDSPLGVSSNRGDDNEGEVV